MTVSRGAPGVCLPDTYSAVRLVVSFKKAKGPALSLLLRVGLTMPSDLLVDPGVDGLFPLGSAEFWTRTLVNLRFAGVYSQARLATSHRLHRGRSPEHFVL